MMSKIEIIPAILPRDFAEVEDKISQIQGLVRTVQIDVCDGQFVPNATWPYRKADDSFKKIVQEADGLPGWKELNFEIDLMVNRPEESVDDWVMAGASRIIIHAEAKGDLAKAVEMLKDRAEVGLALNMDTPIDTIGDPRFRVHEGYVQFIQLMGIDRIGFQGEGFDDKVIGRINEARLKYPALPISIDGGVSLETAPALIAAGANRLVSGSGIFGSGNVFEAVQHFKQIVR
jgi:ribulose-phosphate 3-epimerase